MIFKDPRMSSDESDDLPVPLQYLKIKTPYPDIFGDSDSSTSMHGEESLVCHSTKHEQLAKRYLPTQDGALNSVSNLRVASELPTTSHEKNHHTGNDHISDHDLLGENTSEQESLWKNVRRSKRLSNKLKKGFYRENHKTVSHRIRVLRRKRRIVDNNQKQSYVLGKKANRSQSEESTDSERSNSDSEESCHPGNKSVPSDHATDLCIPECNEAENNVHQTPADFLPESGPVLQPSEVKTGLHQRADDNHSENEVKQCENLFEGTGIKVTSLDQSDLLSSDISTTSKHCVQAKESYHRSSRKLIRKRTHCRSVVRFSDSSSEDEVRLRKSLIATDESGASSRNENIMETSQKLKITSSKTQEQEGSKRGTALARACFGEKKQKRSKLAKVVFSDENECSSGKNTSFEEESLEQTDEVSTVSSGGLHSKVKEVNHQEDNLKRRCFTVIQKISDEPMKQQISCETVIHQIKEGKNVNDQSFSTSLVSEIFLCDETVKVRPPPRKKEPLKLPQQEVTLLDDDSLWSSTR